jgi:hypothetical protein
VGTLGPNLDVDQGQPVRSALPEPPRRVGKLRLRARFVAPVDGAGGRGARRSAKLVHHGVEGQ